MPTPTQSEAQYSEENRLIRIKTKLDETQMLLERFTGTEELSRPYEFQVEMLSTKLDIDLKELLRTPAVITVALFNEKERKLHGMFSSIRQRNMTSQDLVRYDATIVPKVWFLSLDANCRIFQDMTVPDIVEKILQEASISDFQFRAPLRDESRYPKREYCVQYRESSLNFISRLLEEEGIFYFFQHTEEKHTMIFADNSPAQGTCPEQASAYFSFGSEGWVKDKADAVVDIERIEQAHTGKAMLADYNFETPSADLKATAGEKDERFYDYPGEYGDPDEGNRYCGVRLDEREEEQFIIQGMSRCRSFRPGYNFKLKEHFRDDTNADYFLVSVSHAALDTTYRGGEDDVADYRNTFVAIPKATRYRPPRRTRKPIVRGSQTAVVVGKSGEEIWVDKFGRVKVQFFWDRLGKKDEKSSCWIRVSQIWAGKNWGWMTIPRIGQEVIVDFLEGDPDRPIITGRVYNAEQMPPYTLPANQTQSGIKSRSSKTGGTENFNEIRFEDLKGSELFSMHAEKDMDEMIENNRTIQVDGTHTETIKKDTAIEITEGHHSLLIDKGNQSITVHTGYQKTILDQGDQSYLIKMGNQSTKVSMGKIATEAMQSIELKVGPSSILIDPKSITLNAPMITIQGKTLTQLLADLVVIIKGKATLIN